MDVLAIVAVSIFLALTLLWLIKLIWFRPFNINHFYERSMFQLFRKDPEILTTIGVLERFGLNFHNDDLTDESDAYFQKLITMTGKNLEILRSYPREKQTPEQQLSTDILDWFLENQILEYEFMYHNYPINQLFGEQNELPNFMITLHRIGNKRDARNYIKRLSKFGVKFDQILDGLRIREGKGVIPPKFVIERVLNEMRNFLEGDAKENILFTAFRDKVGQLKISEVVKETLLQEAEREIQQTIIPTYRRLIDYFEHLEMIATTDDGVWKLPNGDAYYERQLQSHTSTKLKPEEVHNIGLREVDRIETEMREILNNVGLTGKSIVQHMKDLSQDPRFLYPNTDEGRNQALEDYRLIVTHIDQNLDEIFDLRPSAGVEVERMPSFREETAPGAYYMIPSLDGKRPGVFYVNLRDMSEVQKYGMRTLAYHEAIPGHHFQLALALKFKGPTFRKFIPFTAYVEGWALYAEKIAREFGFFDDPYSELGYLESELFRAVRLVVDTGIHQKRWTREQAIAYMDEHLGQPIESTITEVERYIVIPGQACAYKIGELKIVELRERAQSALGELFEIKTFHNVLLQTGGMPLEILENQVDDYITKTLNAGPETFGSM
ncbi:MAG: hypothetical protein AMJ88_10075 [Anaerolineae bacterium SM23_ 63]|nr:MAG: hypothetical protein AMJ88_10075 [Anaerolineae bacterium SM23_ 63]HEY46225.1 DUF885 domain-containing protein [Anaerolineae bacterium]